MKLPSGGRVLVVAVVIVVALAAAAGFAYATIPDGSGVIHGCYSLTKGPGGLRVIDTAKGQHCNTGESALNWNQTGTTGATGATGATGPTGPSDGGEGGTLSDTTVAASGSFVTVADSEIHNLPGGEYVYSASVYVTPSGGTTVANCFAIGSGSSGSSGLGDTTVSSAQWIPVVGDLELTGSQNAQIECNEDGNVHGFTVHGNLIVTRVGTLHH